MRVVQLAGPSYSGSTVVGYILNAAPGWFFGSEVYRLLPSFTEAKGSRTSRCFACTAECPYWSESLKAELAERDGATLTDLYDAFARRYPDVEGFVDGSKGARWFAESWGPLQVVPARHPIRMVASSLYNQNGTFGFEQNPSFAEFRQLAVDRAEDVRMAAWRAAKKMLVSYRDVLDGAPNPFLCRSDVLHLDSYLELRRLCAHVGVSPDEAMVLDFTAHAVHPVGGNRGPLWQRQNAEGVVDERVRADARRLYYAAQSRSGLGDYRIDDKFLVLLPPDLVDTITGLPPFRQLCELLGYDSAAPAPTAGSEAAEAEAPARVTLSSS